MSVDWSYDINLESVLASEIKVGDILVSEPHEPGRWKFRGDWQFYKVQKINKCSFITLTGEPDHTRRYTAELIFSNAWPDGIPRKIPNKSERYTVMRGWHR